MEKKQSGTYWQKKNTIIVITGIAVAAVLIALAVAAGGSDDYEYISELVRPDRGEILYELEVIQGESIDELQVYVGGKVLTDEELNLLELLLNPENSSKKHSSYREIAEQIPGSNIPKVKRKISRITTKLKNNKRFAQLYPYIIAQEKALEDNYIPVMGDDGNEDDDMYEEFDDMDMSEGWKRAKKNK